VYYCLFYFFYEEEEEEEGILSVLKSKNYAIFFDIETASKKKNPTLLATIYIINGRINKVFIFIFQAGCECNMHEE
jgi:uncharacterized protein YacL